MTSVWWIVRLGYRRLPESQPVERPRGLHAAVVAQLLGQEVQAQATVLIPEADWRDPIPGTSTVHLTMTAARIVQFADFRAYLGIRPLPGHVGA